MDRSTLSRKPTVLIAVLLVLLVADHAPAQTGPIKHDLHVLAVGVNNAHGQNPLRGAENDARAQVEFWKTQQGGELFNGVKAFDPLVGEKATSQAILASLDRLAEDARPGDTAVVALSGHGGGPREGREWGFCAYDRIVTTSELAPAIDRLAKKGVRVLLIVDACQSGGIGIQGSNVIIFAACTATQEAKDGADNGLYTKVLLAGLRGEADANKDGIITLVELDAFVAMTMERLKCGQCPTCGRSANIRSSLPLAITGGQVPITVPSTGFLQIVRDTYPQWRGVTAAK
jgi:hypothetical protein